VKKLEIELPSMYADHHVLDVRRILLVIPGVEDVNASSSFGIVRINYDPEKVNDLQIRMKLDEAGYLGEWTLPTETGEAAYQKVREKAFFRHTQVFETSRQVVSFSQNVSSTGRPLWPCPGMGPLKDKFEEE
jgi:copper chaperone CopZ